jgi:hypothetical protein
MTKWDGTPTGRYQMNGIPLSDRSVRLLTTPIRELMKREREKREFWKTTGMFFRYGIPMVRKEFSMIRFDVV